MHFNPFHTSSQIISGMVSVGSHTQFQLSVVYASNSANDRKELWEFIGKIAPPANIPWAIVGDFNCCRFASDKIGGSPLTQSALFDFNNMIFVNSLLDLHSIGSKFTWFNQRPDNPIHIKLDRVLVNDCWLKAFPESYYSLQSPSTSDHCPIIIHSGTLD
ncbi:hypothetical protein KFK09_017267 [Dendrobium nobile]|uniref:Endonuclease/exonuclease/phosphatase domain-containing protein n=1 Tax=Dendrobium nobile TaxID=94219 RepID=A0A8T3B1V0_DENNO|nr:hypothetical protein KFK09_017267 [Dendrobium nobile]